MKKQVVVIGIGYVGLVSAVCLAQLGHSVLCLDIDQDKIARLRLGEMPIYEPGIGDLLLQNIENGRLSFTTSYQEAFQLQPIATIIAVDTPTGKDGHCDLSRVDAVAKTIGRHLHADCAVIMKSTVPVGTNRRIEALISQELAQRKIEKPISVDIISNPEFLREGAALHDFMHADRVIIGVRNERAEEIMRMIYAPLLQHSSKTRLQVMDPESSELTKYAANTMLAMRISFMNWLSRIADKTGANIDCIREGIGSDRRIGPSFLQAGLGFGGSCFPKDIEALKQIAVDLDINADIIRVIQEINYSQRMYYAEDIMYRLQAKKDLSQTTIAIWGLAFKPNTDDMREAPSLDIIEYFMKLGVHIRVFDPIAMENAEKILQKNSWYEKDRILWAKTPLEAAHEADALLLVTEWDLFRNIDLSLLKNTMNGSLIFDGRNFFSPQEIERYGFDYYSIGRGLKAPLPSTPHAQGGEDEAYSYIRLKRT